MIRRLALIEMKTAERLKELAGHQQNKWWLRTCGSLILFTSFEGNATTLTRVNMDGSHSQRLFSGDLSYPGSRDGKFVYFVNRYRPQKV